jgi:cytochrome c-type biogenesis protein CcmE
MRTIFILLVLSTLVVNCKKNYTMTGIQSKEEIKNNEGKELTVVGVYKPVSFNQKPGKEVFSGHYKIQVNDTLAVVLLPPYKPESKRSSEEVKKFEGKKVKVVGMISDKTYMEAPSLANAPLTVSIPCFTEIKSIEPAE